jgi:TonB family protein
MTETSKHWEGQSVAGVFPLRQYLGESDHSAVFLTEFGEGEPQKAAIKLVPADPATAELRLSNWKFAAQLSHPNLLRLIHTGRCSLDGNDLLYLVMEFAEENLAEILPQRALTAEETRDMLCPVLDALEYLHGKGFTHGDLKPANILASGDSLKLSSDTISRIGEPQAVARKAGVYDPPEAVSGLLTPATDVWSLGMTLVEVMTQRLPDWQRGTQREPVVPTTMAAPFQEIARQCLRLEPHRRIGIADIAARLNARAVAAVASASVSAPVSPAAPAAAQVSPAPPKPVASLPVPPRAAARLQTNPHRPPAYRESGTRSRFIIPLTLGALVFAAIVTVPRILTHRPGTPSTPPVTTEKQAGQPASERQGESGVPSKTRVAPELEPEVSETTKTSPPAMQRATKQAAQPIAASAVKTAREKAPPVPEAALTATTASEGTAKPATMGRSSTKGEVLDQILPEVSQKARDTIRGSVRVGIKVHVDPAGAVSNAELDSPGPSKYFADIALQAARKWAFTPPEVSGKSVASEWSLHFVFTQQDTKVTPNQTAP